MTVGAVEVVSEGTVYLRAQLAQPGLTPIDMSTDEMKMQILRIPGNARLSLDKPYLSR